MGQALALDLLKSSAHVWGLRRDYYALREVERKGVRPLMADLLQPKELADLPEVDFVVLCQAPSEPSDNYQKTYYEGTQNILAALKKRHPQKLIFVSSTSVYATNDGSWVDESMSSLSSAYRTKEEEARASCLLEAEKLVLSNGIPSVVFRLGGIYGPHRNRLGALKEGRMKPIFSDDYSNRIRVEDAVRGIRILMEKGKPGEIYLGVDDEPATQNEFYGWVCEKLALEKSGGTKPDFSHGSNKRCSNKKIKLLGLILKYPNFREGYSDLLKEVL